MIWRLKLLLHMLWRPDDVMLRHDKTVDSLIESITEQGAAIDAIEHCWVEQGMKAMQKAEIDVTGMINLWMKANEPQRRKKR